MAVYVDLGDIEVTLRGVDDRGTQWLWVRRDTGIGYDVTVSPVGDIDVDGTAADRLDAIRLVERLRMRGFLGAAPRSAEEPV